jgi:hypothetical protein
LFLIEELRAFALGDIDDGADVAQKAFAVVAGSAGVHDPAVAAVPTTQTVLERKCVALRVRGRERGVGTFSIVGMHRVEPAGAERGALRLTRELVPLTRKERARPIGLRDPQHCRRRVRQAAEALVVVPGAVALRAPGAVVSHALH